MDMLFSDQKPLQWVHAKKLSSHCVCRGPGDNILGNPTGYKIILQGGYKIIASKLIFGSNFNTFK